MRKPILSTMSMVVVGVVLLTGPVLATDQKGAPKSNYHELLSRDNSLLLLIDLQPQFALSTHSIDTPTLTTNAVGITKAAKAFGVPTILSTNRASTYGGPFFKEVTAIRPDLTVYDRTAISALADDRVVKEIKGSGRKKIIIGGLWTDNCVMLPALEALKSGYEVYILADVSGDLNDMSHNMAMHRLIQAGAVPVTWIAVMLEWQRDWADTKTAGSVGTIFSEYFASVKK